MSPDFQLLHIPSKMHFLNLNMICSQVIQSGTCVAQIFFQSGGYKISAESLLHRVQSGGQREFPSYRSHCPLYSFRPDPINNQSIDVQNLS